MKNKWIIIFTFGFLLTILSGCSEAEEILDKVNQILDQQLEGTDSNENESDQNNNDNNNPPEKSTDTENSGSSNNNDNQDNQDNDDNDLFEDPATMISAEELLNERGYDALDPPNGLPLALPQDWILVEIIQEEPWEGKYCFTTEMFDTIDELEADFTTYNYDITSKNIMDHSLEVHKTTFPLDDAGIDWSVEMLYYYDDDDAGTNCVDVLLVLD